MTRSTGTARMRIVSAFAALAAFATGAASGAPPAFLPGQHFVFPAPLSPTRFALADLDGDGALDAICPGRNGDGRAFLLRGNGNGTFGAPVELSIGAQTDWAEVADLDGDGVLDIVFAVRAAAGGITLRRGAGGFIFGANEFIETGREARALAVDAPSDSGRRPVASLNYANASLRVVSLEGDGSGSLALGGHQGIGPWVPGTPLPQWMGRADADGDGRDDLWISVNGGGIARLVKGTGESMLGEAIDWRSPAIGAEKPGLLLGAVGDIDGNGSPDLAVAGLTISEPQSIVVFGNDGAGRLDDRWSVPVTYEGYAWCAAVGDLDLDGDQDLVLGTALPGQLVVMENLADGPHPSFKLAQTITMGTFVRHATIADMDGDCRPDLVASDFTGNRISVFRNATPDLGGCGGGLAAPGPERGAGAAPDGSQSIDRTHRRAAERLAAMALSESLKGADANDPWAIAEALAEFPPLHAAPRARSSAPREPVGTSNGTPSDGGLADGGLADGFDSCGPPGGPCGQPHGGLGCYTTSCCTAVCEQDPVCCTVAWDEVCVFLGDLFCDGLVCPSAGSCFEPHGSAACDDESCCERVGRLDPFCHSTTWDALCVTEALLLCPLAPCALPEPPQDSAAEGEPCYERWNQGCAATVGGISAWIELGCGSMVHGTCSTGAPRDLDWMRFVIDESRRVRLGIAAEFPLRVLLLEGSCDRGLRTVADRSALDCGEIVIEQCLEPGEYHAVIMVGIDERLIVNGQPCDEVDPDAPPPDPEDPPFEPGFFGLHWQASFLCPQGSIPGDFDGNGQVDGADLGSLLGFWGPNPEGDLDCDGVVDGSDLGVLLGNWTS